MASEWLNVPLADYEGHMTAPQVAQLEPLAQRFAETLALLQPASVAILGIAGGNGLSAIDPNVTRRIAGFDIHRGYLDIVAARYAWLAGLELHCLDLACQRVDCQPFALVHAALVFEHAGTALCLDNALAMVAPEGRLSIVLQLPSQSEQDVSPTGFSSLQSLRRDFRLIDPEWMTRTLAARGLALHSESQHPLPSAKALWHGIFTLEGSGS